MFFALNHLLYFYEPRVLFDAYLQLLDVVPALEVRNGTMVPAHIAVGADRGDLDTGPRGGAPGSRCGQ